MSAPPPHPDPAQTRTNMAVRAYMTLLNARKIEAESRDQEAGMEG